MKDNELKQKAALWDALTNATLRIERADHVDIDNAAMTVTIHRQGDPTAEASERLHEFVQVLANTHVKDRSMVLVGRKIEGRLTTVRCRSDYFALRLDLEDFSSTVTYNIKDGTLRREDLPDTTCDNITEHLGVDPLSRPVLRSLISSNLWGYAQEFYQMHTRKATDTPVPQPHKKAKPQEVELRNTVYTSVIADLNEFGTYNVTAAMQRRLSGNTDAPKWHAMTQLQKDTLVSRLLFASRRTGEIRKVGKVRGAFSHVKSE